MITDIHCHFIPDELFKLAQKREEFATRLTAHEGERIDIEVRGMHFGLNPIFFERKRQIARMDALGIDRTIISLATPMVNYHIDPKLAVEAVRITNDGFAALIAEDRARFGAWAFLPMQDPVAAAAELRRCVREYGFVGGHAATNVRGLYLSDPSFEPLFDAAQDLDVPLFLHPADPPGRDRTGDYELTVVAGYLFDSTINIFRMICSNFLDRYGGLKLICTHTGAFSLMLRNRMQREVDTNRVLSKSLPRKVGDYLRGLYFDTVCFEPEYLKLATRIVPEQNLLLGSDAPFPLGEPEPVKFVREALTPGQAELALGKNFQALTGH